MSLKMFHIVIVGVIIKLTSISYLIDRWKNMIIIYLFEFGRVEEKSFVIVVISVTE